MTISETTNPRETTTKKTQKRTVRSIRRAYKLTLEEVANAAGFSSPTTVYLFEIGAVVDTHSKKKIVQALSTLTGQSYTLSDVEGASALEGHLPIATIPGSSMGEGKSL